MTTPYELLGVSPTASQDELRAAYRRACRLHHPDRGGDAAEFHRVQTAWAAIQRGPCTECGGTGTVKKRSGIFVTKAPCPTCWRKP